MSNQDQFNVKFTLRSTLDAIKWFKGMIQYILHPTKDTLGKAVHITRTLTDSKYLYDAYNALKGSGKQEQLKQESKKEDAKSPSQTLKDEQSNILNNPDTTNRFEFGKMYLYHYDPKTKKELPYYDTFPLIIMVGLAPGGFTGINLHYLPVEIRMILLSNLLDGKAMLKDGLIDRFRVSFDILNSDPRLKMFKPAFKRYLYSHIRGAIQIIPSYDWGYAAALPVENFKKKSKQEVWIESMKSIN